MCRNKYRSPYRRLNNLTPLKHSPAPPGHKLCCFLWENGRIYVWGRRRGDQILLGAWYFFTLGQEKARKYSPLGRGWGYNCFSCLIICTGYFTGINIKMFLSPLQTFFSPPQKITMRFFTSFPQNLLPPVTFNNEGSLI